MVLFIYLFLIWRRKWQPTAVLLPGKSHGWRSLVGYSPWGRKESWDFFAGMMLKLKLQYFGHLMQRVDSLEKTLMLGGVAGRRRWSHKESDTTEQLSMRGICPLEENKW